ncbi:hypothetical protein AB205_0084870 [Aquarana catesbeiana]|uniref:FAD-dependent oxidoreductase domain-containing protein 2 n=1 Tax=Aquarana catesbeiana TaxID=8400 RepID=A0A2G9S578_AQUCT|nr:hypothetical protein AB205_0084870 [Aquarana catesbeiana]
MQFMQMVFLLSLPPVFSKLHSYDYCVLGAGPGGLQIAKFLEDSERDYVVFERNHRPGSFFFDLPRHRKLISINKQFTGRKNKEFNFRHDWNSLLSKDERLLFGKYSHDFFPHADDMVRYLQNFSIGINVRYGTDIKNIKIETNPEAWNGHVFLLMDQTGQQHECNVDYLYNCWFLTVCFSVLLVASGLSLPNVVNFPGAEYTEGYETVSVDPQNFTGQSVLILGRGNSAFETADNILGYTNFIHMLGRSRVRLSWSTHYVGDLRSIRLKSGIGLKKKYPLLNVNYEARHTHGLFVVGTASHGIDFRKSSGGFIHGFRYTAQSVHRLTENRYHNIPWPATRYPISHLLNLLVKRMNEGSGIYQMFETLADFILLGEDANTFEYLEELPVGILPMFEKSTGRKVYSAGFFVLIMEYGKNFSGADKDVFHYNRAIGDAKAAWRSNFLHPVIYFYKQLPTEEQMEARPEKWSLPRPEKIHHVVEDFLTDWTAPSAHLLPLRRFLENCLQTDLRAFYADSCFALSLLHGKIPVFCQLGYLQNQGLLRKEHQGQHSNKTYTLRTYITAEIPYKMQQKDEL